MQNFLTQHPIESHIQQLINSIKNFSTPKKRFPVKHQLSADEIIARLELALNTNSPVTMQINNSLLSEDVANLFGFIYQNNQGQILVQSPKTHKMTSVLPGTIRHLSI
ncbi:hypothetical protein [Leuconostoc gasicomitatum]|uniref:hypothetical protein n=1 Tax=Leuconostoc gasicomitatum TaxID=115778 RepID=UPI0007E16092|nr:hypothetical protein [Leuconostoc gasicomitatum]MBR2277087.1 hypothetical protein [Leuconostoc sp.]MBZ5944439.1 hypothetical protein [Leuconostoc gasicomitatum]MBZ5945276.1 hypothetical protein [Leuconostoc gasicomitatum]MBZ5946963.1 hypothetical protein [Leuconostoc gasicomitatum]MBZ5950351.1 hypothetical protein [Leuconostoc gasicomitatum]